MSRTRIAAISCLVALVGACSDAGDLGRPAELAEGFNRTVHVDPEHADEVARIDALALQFAAREATTREAYAACWGIEPARAELDAWIDVGFEGDLLHTAVCGGELPGFEQGERIDGAFARCLERAPTEEEVALYSSYDLSAQALDVAVCGTEEALRRVIEAAIVRYLGRDPLPDEVEAWLDADLPRPALIREIAASLEAARTELLHQALASCGEQQAEIEDFAEDEASRMATDVLDEVCAGEANPWLVAQAQFLDCTGRVPTEAELKQWTEVVEPHTVLDAKVCQAAGAAATPRGEIAAAYRRCLGRPARPEEIEGWLATGKTTAQIVDGICTSPEARRHRIAQAYAGCLGRPARPDEIDGWAKTEHSDAEVTRQICTSPEARRHAVRVAYQQCLGRGASVEEIDAWANTQLSAGEVRHAICNSEEARKRGVIIVSHFEERPVGWFYDIWRNNCHTAANAGVLASPGNTGIVACRPDQTGMGPRGRGVGGHTFNYRLENGKTSYWNWGPPPCECPGTPPADYTQPGCHRECVDKMCLGQFDAGQTRALPVGQLVEVPGVSICAGQTLDRGGGVDQCTACCDDRANTNWSGAPDDPANANRESYRAECKTFCEGFFR